MEKKKHEQRASTLNQRYHVKWKPKDILNATSCTGITVIVLIHKFKIKYTDGPKNIYTHFSVQNICLNSLLVYVRFNFENFFR
jgi:hypothetical protein